MAENYLEHCPLLANKDRDFRKDSEQAESLRRFLVVLTSKRGGEEDIQDEDQAEILKWFKELGDYAWQDSRIRTVNLNKTGQEMTIPKFFLLLSECLLTHRWSSVLQVLTQIVKQPALQASTICKVGFEVFLREGSDYPELLQRLVSQFKNVSALHVKEVVLDYVMLLMAQGHHQDAREQFSIIGQKHLDRKKPTPETCRLDAIFQAYYGLVWFVEWQKMCNDVKELRQRELEGTLGEEMGILQHKEQLLDSHGKKALEGFKNLENQPGLWDIFIRKHVEILEYNGLMDDAADILRSYSKRNPDNPNSHRYLYEFYVNHHYELQLQLEALQQYCDRVPSDEMSLKFHSLLLEKGEPAHKCLYLLFDLLDYGCCRDNIRMWKTLAEQLRNVMQSDSEECTAYVNQCWTMRSSWWPPYHFKNICTSDGRRAPHQLREAKSVVARLLLGPGNAFSVAVQQQDPFT